MKLLIIKATIVFLEVMVNDFFIDMFFYEKYERKFTWRVLRIAAAAAIFMQWIEISRGNLYIKILGGVFLSGFYTVLFFKANFLQGLCFNIVILSLAFGVEAIALFGVLPMFTEEIWSQAFIQVELLAKVSMLGLVAVIRYIWLNKNKSRWIPKNIFIFLIYESTVLILNVFCADQIQKESGLSRILVPIVTGAFILNLCSLLQFTVFANRENELREMDRFNRIRDMELEIHRSKTELYDRQAGKIHDYKNQLLVISNILEKSPVESVQQYIKELTGELVNEMDAINTNHRVINAILNIKYSEAKKNGVTLNIQCSDLSRVEIEEADLVVLLGNLLDNAIEACECEDGDKYIQFKMIMDDRQLIISTKNRSRNKLIVENGRFVSTKKDFGKHGIGTINIEAAAKKHGGMFALSRSGEYVKGVIIIPVHMK